MNRMTVIKKWMAGLMTAVMVVLVGTDAVAAASRIRLWESESADATTLGSITVAATPEEVFARITDYQKWPSTFSDVAWVKVESGGPMDAVIQFESRTLKQTVRIRFDNQLNKRVAFTLVEGPPRVDSRGELFMQPAADGHGTRILTSFFMDLRGFPIPGAGAVLRSLRNAKIQRDMEDFSRIYPVAPLVAAKL